MYERLTKWIPQMGSYVGSCMHPWMWPSEFEKFLDDLSGFPSPFGGECLEPEEIWLAGQDKDFLDSLKGEVIISAIRDVFGADRIVEGVVNKYASAGIFHKFLVRLKELDEGKPIVNPLKKYAYHERAEKIRLDAAAKQKLEEALEAFRAKARQEEKEIEEEERRLKAEIEQKRKLKECDDEDDEADDYDQSDDDDGDDEVDDNDQSDDDDDEDEARYYGCGSSWWRAGMSYGAYRRRRVRKIRHPGLLVLGMIAAALAACFLIVGVAYGLGYVKW